MKCNFSFKLQGLIYIIYYISVIYFPFVLTSFNKSNAFVIFLFDYQKKKKHEKGE